jgi:hypothetical protein
MERSIYRNTKENKKHHNACHDAIDLAQTTEEIPLKNRAGMRVTRTLAA